MAKDKTYPNQIFVVEEVDGNDSWLSLHKNLDEIEDGTVVAVYTFQTKQRAVVNRQLEDI